MMDSIYMHGKNNSMTSPTLTRKFNTLSICPVCVLSAQTYYFRTCLFLMKRLIM